jgi:hypothetical protein
VETEKKGLVRSEAQNSWCRSTPALARSSQLSQLSHAGGGPLSAKPAAVRTQSPDDGAVPGADWLRLSLAQRIRGGVDRRAGAARLTCSVGRIGFPVHISENVDKVLASFKNARGKGGIMPKPRR